MGKSLEKRVEVSIWDFYRHLKKSAISPGDWFSIPAFKDFDQSLTHFLVTPLSFEDYIKRKRPTKSRLILLTFITVCAWIAAFRFITCALSNSTMISTLLGDGSYVLGDRIMVNLCLTACYTYVAFNHTTFFVCSLYDDGADWCIPLVPFLRGVNDPMIVGIEPKTFPAYKRTSTLAYKFSKFLRIFTIFYLGSFFVCTGLYACYLERNIGHCALYGFWSMFMVIMNEIVLTALYYDCFGIFISSYYLGTRFTQVDNRLAKLVNTPSDKPVNEEALWRCIEEHNTICSLVWTHNKRWKLTVFDCYFVLIPIICFNIFTVALVEMFITGRLIMYCLLFVHFAMVVMCLFPSAYLSERSKCSKNKLYSIAAKRGLDLNLVLLFKLRELLKKITSVTIGFYNLSFFPVTYDAIHMFVGNNINVFFLVYGLVLPYIKI